MKRLRICLLLLIVLALLVPTAAAEQEIYFEKGDFTLTVPEGMVALYQGMSYDDPAWSYFNVDKDNLMQGFLDDGIMAEIVVPDLSYGIFISALEHVPNEDHCSYGMHLYSDEHLEKAKGRTIASSTAEQYVDEVFTYVHPQTDMVYYQIHNVADPSEYVVEYQVANGGTYIYASGIVMVPGKEQELDQAIRQVMDHMTFHNVVNRPEDAPTITPEQTVDLSQDASLYVPRNWAVINQDENTVSLESDLLVDFVVPFGFMDLWEEASDSEKAGYSREDWNMESLEEDVLADLLGVTDKAYTKILCGENTYYMVPCELEMEAYNNEIITGMDVMCIRNGVLYETIFPDTAENKLYSDFLLMLERLQMPAVEVAEAPPQPVKPVVTVEPDQIEVPEKKEKKGGFLEDLWQGALIGAVTALLIGVVKVLLTKKKKEQREDDRNYQPPVPPRPKFCTKCGSPVTEYSAFCSNCGAKIE